MAIHWKRRPTVAPGFEDCVISKNCEQNSVIETTQIIHHHPQSTTHQLDTIQQLTDNVLKRRISYVYSTDCSVHKHLG